MGKMTKREVTSLAWKPYAEIFQYARTRKGGFVARLEGTLIKVGEGNTLGDVLNACDQYGR